MLTDKDKIYLIEGILLKGVGKGAQKFSNYYFKHPIRTTAGGGIIGGLLGYGISSPKNKQKIKDDISSGINNLSKLGSVASTTPADILKIEADYDVDSKTHPLIGKAVGTIGGYAAGAGIYSQIMKEYERDLKDSMLKDLAKCGSNERCIESIENKYKNKRKGLKNILLKLGVLAPAGLGAYGGYKLGQMGGNALAKLKAHEKLLKFGKLQQNLQKPETYEAPSLMYDINRLYKKMGLNPPTGLKTLK